MGGRNGSGAFVSALRVVHLVGDLIRGGTEGQCARVAMGLAQAGLPHRIAAFHRRGYFLDAAEAACGPVCELAIRHAVRWATALEVRRFARWLRQERVDLLHAWDADAAIFGQFAARMAGVQWVTSRRDLGQIYPRWKTALMRRADRCAVRTVANAEAVRDHFVRAGWPADKFAVLPNLLDVDEFDVLAAQPFPQADRLPTGPRLAVVNRLDPEKNTGLLIAALPLVRQHMPAAALVVAGAGPEEAELKQKAAALGLAEAVCFLGETPAVPALLRLCQAGALVPSRNEGLSNTLLEYMAAGLPALATDCGGNRELIQDGVTGRLVARAASPAEVAAAWVDLLRDRPRAAHMGRAGRAVVERNHARGPVLEKFRRFYESLGNPA